MVPLTEAQIEALRSLQATWPGVPMVVVGAVALGHYIGMRATNDLDLAIAISLDDFPGPLSAQNAWRPDPKIEHRFYYGKVWVDVLPVGGAALTQGFLDWPSGFRMSVVGFDLAFVHSVEVSVDNELVVRVPNAPVLAFLKMRAWLDRPHEREKDLVDLAQLLVEYVDDTDDRRWADDIVVLALDYRDVSPFIVGGELGEIVEDHHRQHLENFLAKVRPEKLAALGPASLTEAEDAERILDAFRRGLEASRRR